MTYLGPVRKVLSQTPNRTRQWGHYCIAFREHVKPRIDAVALPRIECKARIPEDPDSSVAPHLHALFRGSRLHDPATASQSGAPGLPATPCVTI